MINTSVSAPQRPQIPHQVSGLVWCEYLQDLCVYLRHCVSNFQAGGIQSCVRFWQSLTTDSFLLQFVSNCYEIEFNETPVQASVPRAIQFSPEEKETMDTELKTLLRFGVIVECDRHDHDDGDFASNVFLRPRPDGTSRVILNLLQFIGRCRVGQLCGLPLKRLSMSLYGYQIYSVT